MLHALRLLCRVKDHKANNKIQSAVMVLAMAGPWSVSLNDAVDAASEAAITVVTSAGVPSVASIWWHYADAAASTNFLLSSHAALAPRLID